MTHWRLASEKCSSRPMDGRATFTMAMSRTTMKGGGDGDEGEPPPRIGASHGIPSLSIRRDSSLFVLHGFYLQSMGGSSSTSSASSGTVGCPRRTHLDGRMHDRNGEPFGLLHRRDDVPGQRTPDVANSDDGGCST